MAITPATQTLHQDALQRWLAQQKESTRLYGKAEEPLQETVGMFRPGGGLAEDQARKEKAEALINQVQSGMSSGSLATATGLRVGRDLTKAKLGIEDTRTQFLAQAMQALSGLRGTQAQQTGATVDPTYAPYMGSLTSRAASQAANIRPYEGLEAWSSKYGIKSRAGTSGTKSEKYMELQF